MKIAKHLKNRVEYNEWAIERYLNWLKPQPKELLQKRLPSSCAGIFETFKHIWEAQEYWRGAVCDANDFVRVWELSEISCEQVFTGLEESSKKFTAAVNLFDEKQLLENVLIENNWLKCNLQRFEYIEQVVSHGIYHRGQIVTLAHNLGIEHAPETDYLAWKIGEFGS
ncbi:MAG: DinB family protein [Pyrinomonadaceae bacterium]